TDLLIHILTRFDEGMTPNVQSGLKLHESREAEKARIAIRWPVLARALGLVAAPAKPAAAEVTAKAAGNTREPVKPMDFSKVPQANETIGQENAKEHRRTIRRWVMLASMLAALGFVIVVVARRLRGGKNYLIAVPVPAVSTPSHAAMPRRESDQDFHVVKPLDAVLLEITRERADDALQAEKWRKVSDEAVLKAEEARKVREAQAAAAQLQVEQAARAEAAKADTQERAAIVSAGKNALRVLAAVRAERTTLFIFGQDPKTHVVRLCCFTVTPRGTVKVEDVLEPPFDADFLKKESDLTPDGYLPPVVLGVGHSEAIMGNTFDDLKLLISALNQVVGRPEGAEAYVELPPETRDPLTGAPDFSFVWQNGSGKSGKAAPRRGVREQNKKVLRNKEKRTQDFEGNVLSIAPIWCLAVAIDLPFWVVVTGAALGIIATVVWLVRAFSRRRPAEAVVVDTEIVPADNNSSVPENVSHDDMTLAAQPADDMPQGASVADDVTRFTGSKIREAFLQMIRMMQRMGPPPEMPLGMPEEELRRLSPREQMLTVLRDMENTMNTTDQHVTGKYKDIVTGSLAEAEEALRNSRPSEERLAEEYRAKFEGFFQEFMQGQAEDIQSADQSFRQAATRRGWQISPEIDRAFPFLPGYVKELLTRNPALLNDREVRAGFERVIGRMKTPPDLPVRVTMFAREQFIATQRRLNSAPNAIALPSQEPRLALPPARAEPVRTPAPASVPTPAPVATPTPTVTPVSAQTLHQQMDAKLDAISALKAEIEEFNLTIHEGAAELDPASIADLKNEVRQRQIRLEVLGRELSALIPRRNDGRASGAQGVDAALITEALRLGRRERRRGIQQHIEKIVRILENDRDLPVSGFKAFIAAMGIIELMTVEPADSDPAARTHGIGVRQDPRVPGRDVYATY
ncbi:MAG: hypothetical protein HQL19_08665, partial [Candidatus Omnitrophica bacterium]|nr:hypothetical protein [Candidatus Omnitrophota bacterium]